MNDKKSTILDTVLDYAYLYYDASRLKNATIILILTIISRQHNHLFIIFIFIVVVCLYSCLAAQNVMNK